MQTLQQGPAFLRRRKMLLVLPFMLLPFITLAFWALGGGKGTATIAQAQHNDKGLNLSLPDAHLKNEHSLDKMKYYEQAAADSDKLKARMRDDPYFTLKTSLADSLTGEAKVYDRLKQINEAIDSAKTAATLKTAAHKEGGQFKNYLSTAPLEPGSDHADRLKKMMESMKQEKNGDSEMIAINSMLEKVMDIQHPERVTDRLQASSRSQQEKVFTVTKKNDAVQGFFQESNLSQAPDSIDSSTGGLFMSKAITATVSETQTLVNGATIKLRLVDAVAINGVLIPKDAFVYGKVSLAGERLTVAVSSIRCEQSILPVALSVFDMDGMDGIYIPGAITRDVAKQSTDNALQSIALGSLDPSIGAQAASAGIETAKTLISKKVKLVRVTVKAGYHVLLRDNNKK